MHKTLVNGLAALAIIAVCSSTSFAQTATDTKQKTDAAKTQAETQENDLSEAFPSLIVIEEDWYPNRDSFADALHSARKHYRTRETEEAAAEIDEAASWLKLAEKRADKKYVAELATARADLMEFATRLREGDDVNATKLRAAFAHASAALAKHHRFKSSKAIAEGDMKNAGRHLMAAANHVRNASQSANYEYSDKIVGIYDYYSPYGYWDEEIEFDAKRVEKNLLAIETELESLGKKLGVKAMVAKKLRK